MRVTIFGGSGRIGRIAVRRALEAGHDVTACSGRDLEVPGITNVVGDIQDPEAVRRALSGAEAIIAAVGPRSNTPESELTLERGMQVVIEAARASGIDRLVTLSGAGVDVPGDDKPFLDRSRRPSCDGRLDMSSAASSASSRSSRHRTSPGRRCGLRS